jgi:hypothetical protein
MYIEKNTHLTPLSAATVAIVTLATTGVIARFMCVRQCVVKGVRIGLTTALSSTAGVGNVKIRILQGSPTGEVSVGTIALANQAVSIGGSTTCLYKDFAGTVVLPGQEVCFDVTTAAGAGAGVVAFITEDDPETPANAANMVAGA